MSGRMNWQASSDRQRVRRRGAETIRGGMPTDIDLPFAKDDRTVWRKRSHLTETHVIAKWWRTRSGKSIWVRLTPFKGFDLVDIRSWEQDGEGISRPGKGFACEVKHLPRLIVELNKAAKLAQELGLLDGEAGE